MWATAVHTFQGGVAARSASYMAGGCGANVSPSRVLESAPLACGWFGAFVAVMGEAMTVRTLCE